MWTLFLGTRYFFSRRKEGMISLIGGISVLGVALGVAALIIVLSVMNGFDAEIKEKIVGTYAHVVVINESGITDSAKLLPRIESIPEVENVSGFVTGQAILRKNGSVSGILLKGIDPEKEALVTKVIRYTEEAGRRLKGNAIILGSELMKSENIAIGDEIEILVPYSKLDLEKTRLKVIGSFTSGRYDYDANIAVVGLKTAQKLFRMKNMISGIGIKVQDGMNVDDIKYRLQQVFRYPYIVKTWMDLDRNLVAALALEKKMMFVILAIIVMVACFNIAGSLIMMVMEKTRDVGILKAIGANSHGVRLVFLLQGAMIGFTGIAVGVFSGMFIAERVNKVAGLIEKLTGLEVFPSDVYYFTQIPVKISMTDISMVVSVAAGLTLLAGIYPAWKAARLDPVEAIRYE